MVTIWRTFHQDGTVNSAQPGCTPSPFHSIYHHELSCGLSSSWEGRYSYTPPISALPLSPLWCLRLKVRISSTFSTFLLHLQSYSEMVAEPPFHWNLLHVLSQLQISRRMSSCFHIRKGTFSDIVQENYWKAERWVSPFRQYSRIPPSASGQIFNDDMHGFASILYICMLHAYSTYNSRGGWWWGEENVFFFFFPYSSRLNSACNGR